MGYTYTPGLTVAAATVVRKVRRLPLKGEVLVQPGQRVRAADIVARTWLPGRVEMINAVSRLGVGPEELPGLMLKREGDPVQLDEPIARTKGMLGLFKTELRAPIAGTLEQVSHVTGQIVLRGAPTAIQKNAYAEGRVVAVQPEESATVEIRGTYIQGIFGVGGEATGIIEVLVESPDQALTPERIRDQHADRIIVGGSRVTAEAVRQAIAAGVKGIVCGGLDDADLRDFLGYELGVAITGDEEIGLTLVITEGFGTIGMARATFELLCRSAGKVASINGATQIRAGVIRPEVVIPLDAESAAPPAARPDADGVLRIGTPLRAIRDPYFGRLGKCTALPTELVKLTSETKVRVLEVEFEGGERVTLPRANVELITR